MRHICELHNSADDDQNVHTDLHPVVKDDYPYVLFLNSTACGAMTLQVLLP